MEHLVFTEPQNQIRFRLGGVVAEALLVLEQLSSLASIPRLLLLATLWTLALSVAYLWCLRQFAAGHVLLGGATGGHHGTSWSTWCAWSVWAASMGKLTIIFLDWDLRQTNPLRGAATKHEPRTGE